MRSKQLRRLALQQVIQALRIEAIAAEAQVRHVQGEVTSYRRGRELARQEWETPQALSHAYFEAVQAEFNVLRRLSAAEEMLKEMTHV